MKVKKIKEYLIIIVKVIKLSYLSSKIYTILLWGLNILIGIAIPVSTLIWSEFIDTAAIGILNNEWKKAALWIVVYSLFYSPKMCLILSMIMWKAFYQLNSIFLLQIRL